MGQTGGTPKSPLPAFVSGPIDTHAHIFVRALGTVEGARYAPSEDAPLADYLAHLAANGLAGAILVQPSFLGTDNSFMLSAVAEVPSRLRAVVVVPPEIDEPALADLVARGAVGVRLNLIGAATPDLAAPPYALFLARLRRAGLYVEIQAEGGQWGELLPAAREAKVVTLIDHFGRPGCAEPAECPGLQTILDAFHDPGIFLKFSAPYRFPADAESIARLFLARDAGRIVWGSDWPFTQHPEIADYRTARSWLDLWVGDARLRAAVLDGNVRTLLSAARNGLPCAASSIEARLAPAQPSE